MAVESFEESTGTTADAATAVGCEVARIANTLVFAARGGVVVVGTSGANRVNEERLAARLGVSAASVSLPDPETLRELAD